MKILIFNHLSNFKDQFPNWNLVLVTPMNQKMKEVNFAPRGSNGSIEWFDPEWDYHPLLITVFFGSITMKLAHNDEHNHENTVWTMIAKLVARLEDIY